MLNEPESVTKYIGHHDRVKKDLSIVTSGLPALSTYLLVWSHTLSMFEGNWKSLKSKCSDSDLIQEPKEAEKWIRLHFVEDSFVHLYLDGLLDDIFSTDDIFFQAWANSSFESDPQLKPDWTLYVKPWHTKIDLATCEVKPPGKPGSSDLSDFVKLGVELRTMLNALIDLGMEDANVFAILVKGLAVSTFAMGMEAQVYRMIQLGSFALVSKRSQSGTLSHFVWWAIASEILKDQREQSQGKQQLSVTECNSYWRSTQSPKTKK
ncbi:hypothetical protein EC973_009112 [Apophysomyces ossiformis]|uniref:Uncharacterized protein n=1 Tax=Apophysomyces ossiformis TaxID=679940 RepID=A0A8H7BPL4_9FUNG|nr:hypothetical protein EC973_009112 [Apophysomyces ossiformis]